MIKGYYYIFAWGIINLLVLGILGQQGLLGIAIGTLFLPISIAWGSVYFQKEGLI